MSDSFADLWNATAPVKPAAAPPRTLGSSPSPANGRSPPPKTDVFAALAGSRPITPAQSQARNNAAKPPQQGTTKPISTSRSGDAFGDLFQSTLGSGPGGAGNPNMTIAERAAKAEQDRLRQLTQQQEARKANAQTWAGLDSLGMSSASSSIRAQIPTQSVPPAEDDDWLFGSTSTSNTTNAYAAKSAPEAAAEDWGLDDAFTSSVPARPKPVKANAAPATSSSSSQLQSIWSLEDDHPAASSSSHVPRARVRSDSPSNDFDFGSREDRLLGHESDDDDHGDDLLGFGKPAGSRPRRGQAPARQSASPALDSRPAPSSRAASPPPHLVGQLVEMGFAPQQARSALIATATDSGFNVQTAAESLLSFDDDDQPSGQSALDARPRPPVTSGDSNRARPLRAENRRQSPAGAGEEPDSGEFLAQASKIGFSMFSKANALLKEGRERAQKAYEEAAKAYEESKAARGGAGRSGTPASTRTDGRPKWMQDAAEREVREGEDEWGLPTSSSKDRVAGEAQRDQGRRKPQPAQEIERKPEVKTDDLLSSDAPTAYVSPFRHRSRPKQPAQVATPPQASPPTTQPLRRSAPPTPLQARNFPTASSSAISTAVRHKDVGASKFKLGQYADAVDAYTRGIDALPSGHILLVQLLNNRALARIKVGDGKAAADDCTAVLTMLNGWDPSREERIVKLTIQSSNSSNPASNASGFDALDALNGGLEASNSSLAKGGTRNIEIDLADGIAKALRRRAEAYEALERWSQAREDWEKLAGTGWVPSNTRSEALRGIGRCKRGEAPPEASSSKAAPKSKPAPKPARPSPRRGPTPPSAALQRLQASNAAQDAEENQRAELKDTVDARLLAWKSGKETNLRALIASLDMVLWPELGWQKVGMHELVSPGQVKVRYVKAIAKVHPDKLNVNNTTLEQRMIANGVFGALNEAWLAFKQ
ncbi:hypothetical protein PUNSTDRAFT_85670 [Punctularia strigosozonata HHB-11173 SS5]|uniref:uncharacterized protein n=1 Tax=Punctularia strigosozonata (strain HHB-11173) TaxID=741275 RepID=UPI0004418709|nr:uncharacterized protein PUNSTDRAFT_85670 [Punctularia strigosozonata HHB-11173 SS5]EIN11104.1 hypothetical protein PUNSTDRAFT_85670 [Punctularia strigosozonata HHB-11173 SS5]